MLIVYALNLDGRAAESVQHKHLQALMFSIQSLRQQNANVAIFLNLVGRTELTPGESAWLQHYQVNYRLFPSYPTLLRNAAPELPAEALWAYPVLHKQLTLFHIYQTVLEQQKKQKQPKAEAVLYVDNDTYFHQDPVPSFQALLEQPFGFWAREEPFSQRSPLETQPERLNEAALAQLYAQMQWPPIAPFNSGALLLRLKTLEALIAHTPSYMNYCLRFFAGLSRRELNPAYAQNFAPIFKALAQAPQQLEALPFPGQHFWIVEQLALWLTLAEIQQQQPESFQQGWLEAERVLQGCEELHWPGRFVQPVLSHYFTANRQAFFQAASRGFAGVYATPYAAP